MKFKFYKFMALIVIATLQLSLSWAGDIQKVSEDCYVAKIPDRELGLVMERISGFTFWQDYIYKQLRHSRLQEANTLLGMKGALEDGFAFFQDILSTVSSIDNEIWVAYITPDIFSEKIDKMIEAGTTTILESLYKIHKDFSFMDNIEIFMTVTSSPNALITTHIGIARSVENVVNNRAKGLSLDLHSFAAKVMLARNSKRKYMVNAPTSSMEKILIAALPDAIHVGTKKMLESGSERELKLMEQYPPILSVKSTSGRVIESSFTIYDPGQDDKPWLTVDKDNKNYKDYQWIFKDVFQPTHGTHFIAIDLEKLANIRPVESIHVK